MKLRTGYVGRWQQQKQREIPNSKKGISQTVTVKPTETKLVSENEVTPYFTKLCERNEMSPKKLIAEEYSGKLKNFENARRKE
jgi:hypothetical protein